MRFTAVVAAGLEAALGAELTTLGAQALDAGRGAIAFEGDLELGYRACTFLRTASRVLVPLTRFDSGDAEALYQGVQTVRWSDHLRADGRLWIETVASSGVKVHTRFLSQKTKDAVCDQLRARHGVRPSVDREAADIRIHVHVGREHTTVSLDLAGSTLHERGYRARGGEAPLKETLAAGLLWLGGYHERAARGEPFVDPLCGSGTLLIEAALIAWDIAPGLLGAPRAARRWLGHDAATLKRVLDEAKQRAAAGRERPAHVFGFDASASAVAASLEAARRAGVERVVRVERCELSEVRAPLDLPAGLVVTNPPYGERLGSESELLPLYERLGDVLRRQFPGFTACVLTSSPVLAKSIGLRPRARHPVWNGPLECRLIELPIASEAPAGKAPGWRKPSQEASAFQHRLQKNLRVLGGWAKREGIECYRLYDADVPEYNVAIDRYAEHVVVQEYAAPRSIPASDAARRLRDVLLVTADVLGVPRQEIVLKVRRRQVQGAQYARRDEEPSRVAVHEGGHTFLIDLGGHIDTGLFAEQRALRAKLAEAARGKSFLNLFAYTCTASVYAAAAGAGRTTSVDLSSRYLSWGRENFAANRLELGNARFVDEDCQAFLEGTRERFDVALLNPPSYSRSHRVAQDFEVQRDHAELVRAVMRRLEPKGELLFATHARGFELDAQLREELDVRDLAKKLVPRDFERSPFFVWKLTARAS